MIGPHQERRPPVHARSGGKAVKDLDALYAAIEDEQALSDLPHHVAALTGGRSGSIFQRDAAGDLVFGQMSYWKPKHYLPYYAHYLDDDPWTVALNSFAPGRAVALDGVLAPSHFKRTTMFNELIHTIGDDTARAQGIALPEAGGTIFIGVHRPGRGKPFGPRTTARLDNVARHVQRIFRTRTLLKRAECAAGEAQAMLDRTGKAMFLVDGALTVSRMTARALAIAGGRDTIRVRADRLALDHSAAHQALLAAVRSVVERQVDASCAFLCPSRHGARPFRLAVMPFAAGGIDKALVIVDEPDRHDDTQQLRRFAHAYGLTMAEAATAREIADGIGAREVAIRRGISHETVRSQLKALFQKTGARSQAHLARLLLLMP